MSKKKLTLSVDENLIKVAKMNHINLSELLTIVLTNGNKNSFLASLSDTRLHYTRVSGL